MNSKDKSVDLVYVDVPLIAGYASRGFLAPVDPNLDTSARHRQLERTPGRRKVIFLKGGVRQ